MLHDPFELQNLALDDKLIARAVRVGKHKTKRDAVTAALNEYVKSRQRRKVRVAGCNVEETKKVRSFRDPMSGEAKQKIVREITYRDWRIIGAVAEQDPVEIVVNDNGRIIFGRCTCPHFAEHLMNQGPCEHMLALFKASESMRADRPSSAPADAVPQSVTRRVPSRWEVDDGEAGASQ